MIAMYDLEDNLLTIFDTYNECAKYFNTTRKCIDCYICRSRKNIVDKKLDKQNKRWVRLFKFEE